MRVELQPGGKQQMNIYYVQAPIPSSVEENYEGYFQGHDDFTLAQLLQDQETVYQSLQRSTQIDTSKSSSTTPKEDTDDRQHSLGSSSQTVNADSQLAMDEAYARELQELENQFSCTSLNETSGTNAVRAESSTASSRENSANYASTQVARQDDVDPDSMTYEELQSLGDAIGTHSRGLSDELISYLPVSTYKTGLFQRREKPEDCVICYMAYKNREKLITLPCQHRYHRGCITEWLKINKACPVCNEDVFGGS